RPMALHSARVRLRVSRDRALDRWRATPARVGACAANRWSHTAAVPNRRGVHRRRSRACRDDRRARDRADLRLSQPERATRPRPTVLLRERPGADMPGLVNGDEQHFVAAAQDSGVRRLTVERPPLRDPTSDRAVEPTPALLTGDAALPTPASEERDE